MAGNPKRATHVKPCIPGTLWIVATPIGNLGDISARAREILGGADLIAAEDTRVTRRLLSALGISGRLVSLHEHNERGVAASLVDKLLAGGDIALVSDAGTPLISDPGFRLVRAAREKGVTVSPVPGACAAIAALSVSGLPTDRFWFEGFLPPRAGARQKRLEALAAISATLVFYEASRRLPDTLKDLAGVLGADRPAVLAREMTKQHETIFDGTLEMVLDAVRRDPDQRLGESVIVVGGGRHTGADVSTEALARALIPELPPARAARVLSQVTDLSRKGAFALIEHLKSGGQ